MAHAFDNHNASLREGAPSLVWSGPCLESLIGHGLARIPRVGCDNRGGAAPGVSPPRPGRRTGGGGSGGSDPPFLAAGAAPGRGRWRAPMVTPSPLPGGGRSLHIDPCGKAEMLKSRTRVVLLNLVLTAPGLRAWLSPWLAPGNRSLEPHYSKGSRSFPLP